MIDEKDAASTIGIEVKAIMELIAGIDTVFPDEDLVEVLIGAVNTWGTIEIQVLYPTLEAVFEGMEQTLALARERLNTLHELAETMRLGEGADAPFSELAERYIDGVKYHLLVDIQEIVPLTAQLPEKLRYEIGAAMAEMKRDIE